MMSSFEQEEKPRQDQAVDDFHFGSIQSSADSFLASQTPPADRGETEEEQGASR